MKLYVHDENAFLKKISVIDINDYQSIEALAHNYLSSAKHVLVTDIHLRDSDYCHDYWSNGVESFWLSSKALHQEHPNTTDDFTSVLNFFLKEDNNVKEAIVMARLKVNHELSQLNSALPSQENFPSLSPTPLLTEPKVFESFNFENAKVYPIVDSSDWINKLLPLGVKVIQLRLKNKSDQEIPYEIQKSMEIAEKYSAKLIINDYWEQAIRLNAYGVHLGQEDLLRADIAAIYEAGLRLGISTHCYSEVATAHTLRPSYIACGPIFATQSKVMNFSPLGVSKLQEWCHILNYPLVAIGGIHANNFKEVLKTKVDSIAMISAICNNNYIDNTKHFLSMVNANVNT